MSDPIGDAAFEKQVQDEMARIGLPGSGMNVGGITKERLLEALRSTPDGAGLQVFVANLFGNDDGGPGTDAS